VLIAAMITSKMKARADYLIIAYEPASRQHVQYRLVILNAFVGVLGCAKFSPLIAQDIINAVTVRII